MKLRGLKTRLWHNEQVWSGFQQIAIDAIAARSLPELAHKVVTGIENTFAKVDRATLACLNLDYEVGRLIGDPTPDSSAENRLLVLTQEELNGLLTKREPILGTCDQRWLWRLFPPHGDFIQSVALSPLIVGGDLIGCLAQGSADPDHFSPTAGTELLQHLSAVIALCIQNSVNKARLERDGFTDPLTKVGNRRYLESRLREELERAGRYHHHLTCMMIDIDHFKRVNDVYGHGAGDQALCRVAEVLKTNLRSCDVLARYGGEEFVILLPETGTEEASLIAERQRSDVAGLTIELGPAAPMRLTMSVGIASAGPLADSRRSDAAARLLAAADRALYRAKQAGRDRVVVA